MNYRWTFRQASDESTITKLASSMKIPKSLAGSLAARGVNSSEEAKDFFEPQLEKIHDPFLMDGMDVAVERILKAVRDGEKIWIHGDYDVDGTSSTALTLQFLREIGGKADYYIPDRFHEGYGLSEASIKRGLEVGASLFMTVDVGITSFEAIDYANLLDLDLIICDHHEPGESLPEVLAILDPIKGNCNYPFKSLAACGVAFKLIQGIAKARGDESKVYKYLDYVAIASAADMVPLIGENRVMSRFGLDIMNKNPRPGFKGLLYCTGLKQGAITASNIVYALAPLINAAGRLGDAKRSVEMMIQQDEVAAFRIAQELEQENRRRRAYDELTFEEAIPIAEELLENKDRRALVIHKPTWHAGVIGIVASRLVDKFRVPTVLLTTIENRAKGSARSINQFDIHSALKSCSHLLTEFGGHKHAAGLSLKEENIAEFRELFDGIAGKSISQEMLLPEIQVDAELKFLDLSPKFLKILKKFAPYGYENYRPVFFSKGVTAANGVKIVGSNHLKFRAYQHHFVIDAIGYNLADKIRICKSGKPFSIVYNIEENNYNGRQTLQLKIKDIRPDEE